MKMRIFLTVLLSTFFVSAALSQTMKKFTWSTYKMEFKVPSSFKIDKNTSEIFDAGNDDLHLTIYPEKGSSIAKSEMKSLLRQWAKENKLKYDGKVEDMEDLNGYWGVYVDGSSDGLPTSILLLIDPDYPEISFYVWLQYDASHENTAVNILKSFIPN